MDNTNFIGDLRKNTKTNESKSQDRNTPLDAAAGFIGDLTINQQRNKEVAQFQNYLAEHGGRTPLGTLVRYVGDDPNVASSKWAKAAQDTYNYLGGYNDRHPEHAFYGAYSVTASDAQMCVILQRTE